MRLRRIITGSWGISLVEILIGLVITGILSVFVYSSYSKIQRQSSKESQKTMATKTVYQLGEIINSELRQIEIPTATEPLVLDVHSIEYSRQGQHFRITYSPSTQEVLRSLYTGGTWTPTILANKIEDFSFQYYGVDDDILGSLPLSLSSRGTLDLIEFSISQNGVRHAQEVKLRNFAHLLSIPTPSPKTILTTLLIASPFM